MDALPARAAEKFVRGIEKIGGRPRRTRAEHSIGAVLVGYDPKETRRSIAALRGWLAPERGFIKVSIVVVANSEAAYEAASGEQGVTVVRGSNEEFEFSGYREGIDALEQFAPEALLIANDRLMVYSQPVLAALVPGVIDLVATTPIAVGQVDGVDDSYVVLGHPLRCWIRSNFVLVNGVEARHLIPARGGLEFDRLVPRDWVGERWEDHSDLDGRYAAMLTEWLAPTERHQDTWPQAEHLRPEYWATFRRKVRSIVYEHMLSIGLVERGVALTTPRRARVLAKLSPGRSSSTVSRLSALPSGDDVARGERAYDALRALVLSRIEWVRAVRLHG